MQSNTTHPPEGIDVMIFDYRENHGNWPPQVVSDPGFISYSQRNCFLIKDARVHYVVLKQQPLHTP
jgi:hypothetical protein